MLHCKAHTGQYGLGPNLQLVLWFVFTLSVKCMAMIYLFICLLEFSAFSFCVFVLCLSFVLLCAAHTSLFSSLP